MAEPDPSESDLCLKVNIVHTTISSAGSEHEWPEYMVLVPPCGGAVEGDPRSVELLAASQSGCRDPSSLVGWEMGRLRQAWAGGWTMCPQAAGAAAPAPLVGIIQVALRLMGNGQ